MKRACLSLAILLPTLYVSADEPLQYVDTRVGTAASETGTAGMFGKNTEEYGQTLPAVLEPNGMNFWTPQTQDTEQKCKAPYYYKHDRLQGFRNSHWIVGGCTQDYGSMTLMPLSGQLRCRPEDRATIFSHDDEIASPAYYSVRLPQEAITAELTGRSRSAIFRFTYDNDGDAYLVVNPNSDEGEGYIEVDSVNRRITGFNPVHRIYQGWGEPAGFSGHFLIEIGHELTEVGTFKDSDIYPRQTDIGGTSGIGAYVKFKVKAGEQVTVKAASSFTDAEGALGNLNAEIPHWDFNRTREELETVWDRHLSAITVESNSDIEKSKFYGALYRASFLPRTMNDVDGRYPSFGGGIHIRLLKAGATYYDDFSMWDTYRALHPLITLLHPTKSGDMMQSIIFKAEQGGWLPIFPCWNSYTAAMIGDHCTAAIGDAYIKGVRNFDIDKAYRYMRQNAFESPSDSTDYINGMGRRALSSYLKYGYIPLEDSVKEAFHQREQVSRTLEYAYDDFVLSVVADELGHHEDASELRRRSKNYANVVNPSTGYVQGRYADGRFLSDDNAFDFTGFITEGAPCHYTWYAPHDVDGLMSTMGGHDAFAAKLDSMFTQQRYWHGNEPCHQVAWMFNYAGQPWRTQKEVRNILKTEYLNTPGGLAGNDDAGQMSAWYIFASLGFYPVCPGTPYYMIGSPTFPKATLHLENGCEFTIIAHNASEENIFVQSAMLNGRPYDKNFLKHADIMDGGVLELTMGRQPNREWGSSDSSILHSVQNSISN
ncbi:MAG: GH92 family glycosyl hydrolase [Muribaculum sp.]|nr:GH92 family glycosyl hydrolase [Muribaculum sp.]